MAVVLSDGEQRDFRDVLNSAAAEEDVQIIIYNVLNTNPCVISRKDLGVLLKSSHAPARLAGFRIMDRVD